MSTDLSARDIAQRLAARIQLARLQFLVQPPVDRILRIRSRFQVRSPVQLRVARIPQIQCRAPHRAVSIHQTRSQFRVRFRSQAQPPVEPIRQIRFLRTEFRRRNRSSRRPMLGRQPVNQPLCMHPAFPSLKVRQRLAYRMADSSKGAD